MYLGHDEFGVERRQNRNEWAIVEGLLYTKLVHFDSVIPGDPARPARFRWVVDAWTVGQQGMGRGGDKLARLRNSVPSLFIMLRLCFSNSRRQAPSLRRRTGAQFLQEFTRRLTDFLIQAHATRLQAPRAFQPAKKPHDPWLMDAFSVGGNFAK